MTTIVRLPWRYIGYFCSLTLLLPPSAPNIRVIFGSKICITSPLTLLLSPKVRYFHCPSIATENKAHTSIPSISWLLPPASMFLARLIIPLMFHNARFLCSIASTQDMGSKKRKKKQDSTTNFADLFAWHDPYLLSIVLLHSPYPHPLIILKRHRKKR